MSIKTLACALAVSVAPALAFASGCPFGQHQTQSCAPGTVWDADANKCVAQISS